MKYFSLIILIGSMLLSGCDNKIDEPNTGSYKCDNTEMISFIKNNLILESKANNYGFYDFNIYKIKEVGTKGFDRSCNARLDYTTTEFVNGKYVRKSKWIDYDIVYQPDTDSYKPIIVKAFYMKEER